MYSGESISSVIHLDALTGFLNPAFLTTKSTQGCCHLISFKNLETTEQKTKNFFMAHLECESQAFFYYNNIQ